MDRSVDALGQVISQGGLAASSFQWATQGEMTTSPYCSGKEVQYASDYKIQVVPLWAAGVYPPKPPGCGQSYVDMIFRPNLVYLDCREKSIQQIAADIANRLHRCSSKSRSGSA